MVDVFDRDFQDLTGGVNKASGGDPDQDDSRANTVKKIMAKGPGLKIKKVKFPGENLILKGDFAPPKIILPAKNLEDPSLFKADCMTHNKA